jgi:predicted metal-dependent hydrolase
MSQDGRETRFVVGGLVPERDRNAEGRAENARPRDRFGRPLPYGSPDEMADRQEPGDVVATIPEALHRAVALFDQQRFFEAHEFLEWIWKSDLVAPADRDYWKGVTQVAVGCAHTQRGNTSGATTLLTRARRYLAPYPSPYGGVDRDALDAGAQRVLDQIRARGAGPDLDFPRFPLA